jgi:hypothetical protein
LCSEHPPILFPGKKIFNPVPVFRIAYNPDFMNKIVVCVQDNPAFRDKIVNRV